MPFGQSQSPRFAQNQQNAANAYQTAYGAALPGIVSDLNSGNFGGAFQAAAGLPTNYNLGVNNTLLPQLVSASGLQQIDPSMQWTPQSINAYYQAAMQPKNWNALTAAQNPYSAQNTAWGQGGAGKAASDAAANIAAGGAPDLGRFAGYNTADNKSLFGNIVDYATSAAPALILGAAMPAALPALAGELGGSSLAAGALYGAGTGAISSAVNGGNIGKGALIGGLTGGLGASGAVQGATSGADSLLTDVYGVNPVVSGALTSGAANAGLGAIRGALSGTGAANGALTGGVGGAIGGGLASYFGDQNNQMPLNTMQNTIVRGAAGAAPGLAMGNPGAGLLGAIAGAGNTLAPGLGSLGASLGAMSGIGRVNQPAQSAAPVSRPAVPTGAIMPSAALAGAPQSAQIAMPFRNTAPGATAVPGAPAAAASGSGVTGAAQNFGYPMTSGILSALGAGNTGSAPQGVPNYSQIALQMAGNPHAGPYSAVPVPSGPSIPGAGGGGGGGGGSSGIGSTIGSLLGSLALDPSLIKSIGGLVGNLLGNNSALTPIQTTAQKLPLPNPGMIVDPIPFLGGSSSTPENTPAPQGTVTLGALEPYLPGGSSDPNAGLSYIQPAGSYISTDPSLSYINPTASYIGP